MIKMILMDVHVDVTMYVNSNVCVRVGLKPNFHRIQ